MAEPTEDNRDTCSQDRTGDRLAVERLQQQLENARESLRLSQDNQSVFIEKLKKTRRDFLAIFDSVPAMIWYRDRQGKILRANRCAADSVGMSVKELVGRNYYELFPDETQRARHLDEQVMLTGQSVCGQLRRFMPADGTSERWAMVDRIPLRNHDGRIEGVMVYAQDITEKKKAQDQLILAQKEIELRNAQLRAAAEKAEKVAESACKSNRIKSEILASSSHDLRTPMNAILGFADLLLETALDQDQRQYVNTIRNSASGLLSLVNDILDFTQLEAGKLKIQITSSSMSEFLEHLRAMMETGARRKGLEFTIEADPKLPQTFYTDPLRLKQCLINLLGNAIKFTDQGFVRLTVSPAQHGARPCIQFDVEDSGIGIPPEKRDDIFKIFTQADVATAHKYGGSGLGLTITRRLGDLLGGTVTLDSAPRQGSKFSLLLPLLSRSDDFTQQLSTDNRKRRAQDAEPTGWKILLAEGSIPSQLTMNLLLRRAGMQVRAVNTVDEIKQQLAAETFDVLLLDGAMTDDPAAIVNCIRNSGSILPMIVLVDNDHPAEHDIIAAGAGVLRRPVSRRSLYDAIAEQMQEADDKQKMKTLQTSSLPPEEEIVQAADPKEAAQLLPALLKELQGTLEESDRAQAEQVLNILQTVSAAVDNPLVSEKIDSLSRQLQFNAGDISELSSLTADLEHLCRDIFKASEHQA